MTIGIEKIFGDYIGKEYGNFLRELYYSVIDNEKIYPHAELICYACRRTYPIKNYKCNVCDGKLEVFHEENSARIKCLECGKSLDIRPRCENDGNILSYFLIGNHRTIFRFLPILLSLDSEEYSTVTYVSHICDIANIYPPLKYLSDEGYVERGGYITSQYGGKISYYRKTNSGCMYEEKLMKPLEEVGLKKILTDFMAERIDNELSRHGILFEREISDLSIYYNGKIYEKKRKLIIRHIGSEKW